jgi:sugar/nucleoside kinase (ribokinase family)
MLTKDDILWKKLKTKWIYLAPLAGSLCDIFGDIVNFAVENKIKVAVNLSKQQLSLPSEKLKTILQKVDILFLNQEEASFLTKLPFEQENEIFKKIDEICPGIAVMTKGGEGVVVSDGKYMYSAMPNPDREIVDTTGAGDSFASGFLSGFIRFSGDIVKSIQLGLGNSEGNLSQIGAKTGLLSKKSDFKRVEVTKQLCTENNLCITK